ncbi:MAG TPA: glycosyltransferase family 1 protein [Deltaproteobacteria bacterium]|nr:glycosyltransferase family 1 protein [Deltaproteobacteria bacterium]
MKKIAVVIPKYGVVGGAEQFVAELTENLRMLNSYDYFVYANRWRTSSATMKFHKVPIITLPKFLTTLSFAYFARCGLANNSFDIVHSHDRIFSADLFTLHGIPHRYWVRNIRRKKMSLYDAATSWMEKKMIEDGGCYKFIAVSELTKKIFLEEYPIDPEKVAVIHPGVHLKDFTVFDRAAVRAETRKIYGIPADEPVLIFASMNFEIKGLDYIMNSLSVLKSEGHLFRLIIAGKGNKRKYARLAYKTGIAENIIFTGRLDKKNLIRHYLAADMYIMLSAFDTFGMVVLEAMAAGLPVIISGNVGAKDLVEEGINGLIIDDPANYNATARKINLLFDRNIREKMAASALQTAAGHTWEKTAAKYDDIYTGIMEMKTRMRRGQTRQ